MVKRILGDSAAFHVSTLILSPMRRLLGLAMPTASGWSLIGGGAVAAVALSRILAAGSGLVAKSAGARQLFDLG